MVRPSSMDEQFVHQAPLLLPQVTTPHEHWRESHFFDLHEPGEGAPDGDAVFFTMANYPTRSLMDSLQMGRVGGDSVFWLRQRAHDGDPHTTEVAGARVEIVEPWEEVRLFAEPAPGALGVDLVFRARTEAHGLRRGSMHVGDEIIWDQSHILQSGIYSGTYTVNGVTRDVDGWIGQRDHSWGVRDHGRCPLWLWFQIQLEDGFLGAWHWEFEDGRVVYTDGCWAGADRSEPVPLTGFTHDVRWTGEDGAPAEYGEHGDDVVGLEGSAVFELADGRRIAVEATGSFARPYEPFHRGGLNVMAVTTDDGRSGTAIYEVTGARHHHFFPDATVGATLPS